MKRIMKIFAGILICLLVASYAFAAGTCTPGAIQTGGGVYVVSWTWTSDASGDVSGSGGILVSGWVTMIKVVPGTGVSTYDLTLLDESDVPLVYFTGLPTTVDDVDNVRTPFTADGGTISLVKTTVTPKIENAGNAKSGTIYLYISK